ncbi:MAG: cysteine synthase A [Clostridia bacterium]|nr:cysteine synthase A [Clostridia bacterium]
MSNKGGTMSALKSIGNTPLLRLEQMDKGLPARIFAKVEGVNPAGSIKDRVALAIIEDAEKNGRLTKGGSVIEATSGNTGIGLAYVCRQRGYRAIIVMPDTMSVERRQLIASYGAEVVLTDGTLGMQAAVARAQQLLRESPNAILADQFNNPICADVHYRTTGVEIWEQTAGKVDIFVACVGTGGTLTGIGKRLKECNPNVQVIAVEPAASPLLSKGIAGNHTIQGIGANFIPKVLDCSIYDEVLTVTDEEAFAVAKRLNKTENVSVGISSGAAVAAAISVAKRVENAGKTIVTILPDEGGRYASTALFD